MPGVSYQNANNCGSKNPNDFASGGTLLTSEASELMGNVDLSQIHENERDNFKKKKKVTPRFGSGVNRWFNSMVTDSEGWILNAVEENEKKISNIFQKKQLR